MKATSISVVHICTSNDINGNPRRGWLLTMNAMADDGTTSHLSRCLVDEGYRGAQAVGDALPYLVGPELTWAMANALEVNVQPKEYLRLVKQYGMEG